MSAVSAVEVPRIVFLPTNAGWQHGVAGIGDQGGDPRETRAIYLAHCRSRRAADVTREHRASPPRRIIGKQGLRNEAGDAFVSLTQRAMTRRDPKNRHDFRCLRDDPMCTEGNVKGLERAKG